MHVVLFEDDHRDAFLPFVFTRPVGELRLGILTISEKWAAALDARVSHATAPHLQELFPPAASGGGYLINARLLPTPGVTDQIRSLGAGELLRHGDVLLAARYHQESDWSEHAHGKVHHVRQEPFLLRHATDLFNRNGEAIELDFTRITSGRTSHPAGSFRLVGPPERFFAEEGARVSEAIINVEDGPVYLGREAQVQEGALIRGPFVLGDHAQVKMGTRIYGPVTAGPWCRLGGEVSSSVLFGYSNKGHDGFLGHSVIGEWCNLGADTNTSNLKNNYGTVKTWNFPAAALTDSGLTFCGLLMGDHSRSGINTMFNTGTVAGVAANVFGSGFPPKFIPSFSWGGPEGWEEFRLEEALVAAERMMQRRSRTLRPEERRMLTDVFRMTARERQWKTDRQA